MVKPRILIADDDPDILDVLEITLSQDNYEIIKAMDGEEALQIIKSKPLDLVLLDYNMPRMNGRQVCMEVKKDILLRHLPIIMVTGKGEVSDKVGGIDAGA
ncbi:MAG: response regulator, partial [Candidatus Omnitrophica bacterium]|nr:response regulator [Candidatus Omnitrophota bacterium]